MLGVEFVSALVALGTLEPWTLPVVGVVDLRPGTQSIRGAVARCFELVDAR